MTPADSSADRDPFKDAEAWLADRGIEPEPIRVEPSSGGDGRAPITPREARRIATESPLPPGPPSDATDERAGPGADLGELVADALNFIRRSTAHAPQSEQRLRTKLEGRGHPAVVIDRALERARVEGTVDDRALARAIAEERRAKGHAPFRIRVDLGERGFPDPIVDEVLVDYEAEDPESQALDLALAKARASRNVDAETAFRRVVGHLARRGYPEALARKVAREAVFNDREDERIAGR